MELPRKLQIERPIVKFRNKSVVATRAGRGYSLKELNEAGVMNHHLARLHGLPIDKLRNTTYQENIDKLRNVTNKINEPKIVKEKPSEDRNTAKPKVIKKRTIRRKLIHND